LPRVYEDVSDESSGEISGFNVMEKVGEPETIVLVEDDETVRFVEREILSDAGFNILEAECGEEALKICEEYEGRLRLVITDVVMPGMNGRELVRALDEKYPDMKAIYVSGYTRDVIKSEGDLEPGAAFVQKPFSADFLLEEVKKILKQSDEQENQAS